MISDYSRDLLRSGIIELKAGNRDAARRYVDRALYMSGDPDVLAEAWYWMSQATDDPVEKRKALENCLANDLQHARARRALALLDGKLKPDDIVDPETDVSLSEQGGDPGAGRAREEGKANLVLGATRREPATKSERGGDPAKPDRRAGAASGNLALDPEGSAASARLSDASAQRFMCPKCGGRMTFSPDGQSLVCEYCRRSLSLRGAAERRRSNLLSGAEGSAFPSDPVGDKDFLLAMATLRGHSKPLAEQVFACQGCGAQFILSPGRLSITCPYCASPHVVSFDKSSDLVAPDAIIPFAFGGGRAQELLDAWLPAHQPRGPKAPAPDATDRNKLPEIRLHDEQAARIANPPTASPPRGLYLPVWTFDLRGVIDYTGTWIEEAPDEYGYRSARTVQIEDSYPVILDGLPIPGSRKLSGPFIKLLPTFDLKAAQPYDPRYLADWPADLYDIPMDEASLDARSQGFAILRREMAVRLQPVQLLSTSSARLVIESFRLNLLPVWMAEVQGHLVLINGQTGDIYGDFPSRSAHSGSLLSWLSDIIKE